MKMRLLARIVFVVSLIALLVALVVPAAFAQGTEPPQLPSDLLQLILTVTVAQAVGWILTAAIPAVVAYALVWIPGDSALKPIVGAVLIAVLTALVTSLAQFIPDTWMQMKLIDAAVAIVGLLAAGFGGWKFGLLKGQIHYVNAFEVRGRVKQLTAGK